ncbi:MAG: hypothetical protein AAFX05_13810 [Planctomycetota bacterium]
MTRPLICHLLESDAENWPSQHAVAQLVDGDTSTFEHQVVLLGHGRPVFRLPSERRLPGGVTPVRARAAALRRILRRPPTLIHAWSTSALSIAHRALPRTARMLSVTRPPSGTAASRSTDARVLQRCPRSVTVFSSTAMEERWMDVVRQRKRVVSLPVTAPNPDARAQLRAMWGVDGNTIVVVAIGEPSRNINAHSLVYAGGVQAVAGRPIVSVIPPEARDLERGLRFTERHHGLWRAIVHDAPTPAVLPGADLAIWKDDPACDFGAATRRAHLGLESLAWAAAFRVPIVAEDRTGVREMVGDDGAVFVGARSTLAMNRGIAAALSPEDQRARRVAAAAGHVERRLDVVGFIRDMESLQAEVLGLPTDHASGHALAGSIETS